MGPPPRRFRVLVVDDERFVLRALERGLSKVADVVGCTSVDEALAVLDDDDRFDVVVSDLGLEGGSGLELYHALEERHAHLQRQFILMTGDDLTEDRLDVEVLQKPFDLREARALIAQVAGPVGEAPETR